MCSVQNIFIVWLKKRVARAEQCDSCDKVSHNTKQHAFLNTDQLRVSFHIEQNEPQLTGFIATQFAKY